MGPQLCLTPRCTNKSEEAEAVPHSQYYHQFTFHFGFKHTFEVKRTIKQDAVETLQKGPVKLKSYLWLLPFQKGSPQQVALNI